MTLVKFSLDDAEPSAATETQTFPTGLDRRARASADLYFNRIVHTRDDYLLDAF